LVIGRRRFSGMAAFATLAAISAFLRRGVAFWWGEAPELLPAFSRAERIE